MKCPHCKTKLTDFFVEYDPPTVKCGSCERTLDPKKLFTRSTINHLQYIIPEEKREAFFAQLGFERRPKRESNIGAFLLLMAFLLVLLSCFGT